MVFGVPDQDLIPLLDRVWDDFRAFSRSGRLWNRWRCFGHSALEVRRMTAAGSPHLLMLTSLLSLLALPISQFSFRSQPRG